MLARDQALLWMLFDTGLTVTELCALRVADVDQQTGLLLAVEESNAFPLTPSATQVFLTLLQAYPHACSYQSLFRSLSPLASTHAEREEVGESKLAVSPIRRALKAPLPTLRNLGWQVIKTVSQERYLFLRRW